MSYCQNNSLLLLEFKDDDVRKTIYDCSTNVPSKCQQFVLWIARWRILDGYASIQNVLVEFQSQTNSAIFIPKYSFKQFSFRFSQKLDFHGERTTRPTNTII